MLGPFSCFSLRIFKYYSIFFHQVSDHVSCESKCYYIRYGTPWIGWRIVIRERLLFQTPCPLSMHMIVPEKKKKDQRVYDFAALPIHVDV